MPISEKLISSCKHEVQFGVRREAILPPPVSSGTTAGPEKPFWLCSSAVVCGTKWQPQPRCTPVPRLPWVLVPHPPLPPHHPQPALPRSSERSPHPQAPLAEHTEKVQALTSWPAMTVHKSSSAPLPNIGQYQMFATGLLFPRRVFCRFHRIDWYIIL